MIKVVGLRNLSFTSKDGDLIEGTNVYFQEIPNDGQEVSGLVGIMCDKVFMSRAVMTRILNMIKKDTLLEFEGEWNYNKYGKIDGVRL